MSTVYEWTDDAGDVRLRATPSPSIIGGFEDWTQDPTTKAVTVTLPDKDQTPLTFSPPTGATADSTNQIVVQDDTGFPVFRVDASGDTVCVPESGSAFEVNTQAGPSTFVANGDGHLAFFNATPVAQQSITGALSTVVDPAAKAVLTSIVAALVALGLATDGTT